MSSPHPRCPVCKHHHRRGDDHIWEDDKPSLKDVLAVDDGRRALPKACSSTVEPVPHKDLVVGSTPAAPTTDPNYTIVLRDKSKMAAYMRDYRKATKAGLSVSAWRVKSSGDANG